LGTSMVIAPLVIPPVAAVYVKVIELPVERRSAVVVAVLSVPEPCGAFWTSIDGEDASAVYEPPPVERCRVPHDCAPVEVGAVPVYVIVSVEPAVSVTLPTVTTWPLIEMLPALELTWP